MSEGKVWDIEAIRAAGARMCMHLDGRDEHMSIYRSLACDRLTVHSGGPRGRRSTVKPYKVFVVDGVHEFGTLAEAVAKLNEPPPPQQQQQQEQASP